MDKDPLGPSRGNICEICHAGLTDYHRYWDCISEHSTCHTCIPDCIFSGGLVTCPRQGCGETLAFVKPQQGASEGVYIFVDNSNMWIEAKKLAAKRLHLKSKEDPRLRIDSEEVTSVVAKNRKVARATLYGSEPPPIGSVWKKMEEHGWTVFTKERSSITNKEKQVDQQLVVDITDLASDASIQKGMIIIFSGDADIIPAIKCGIKKKWKFEIWMWASGISKSIKVVQKKYPESVRVVKLDQYFNDITFTEYKFDMNKFEPHLKSHTAVITNVNFEPTKERIKKLCGQLGWPFQFSWVDENTRCSNTADIILVFANVKTEDGESVEDHFNAIFQKLKESYGGKVKSYPEYEQKNPEQFELSTSNRYKKLSLASEPLAKTVNRNPCERNKVIQVSSKGSALSQEFFDDGLSEKREIADCGVASSSCDIETSASPQLQGFRTSNPSSDNTKESVEGFTTVVHRSRKKKHQKSSEPCPNRGSCREGTKCKYLHTSEEKEFFQKKTKPKLCHMRPHCHKGSSCNYAHSLKELFCRLCSTCGHLEEKCSEQ